MKILELKERRSKVKNQIDEMIKKAKDETRSFNPEERTKVQELEAEYDTLDTDIRSLEKAEARNLAATAAAAIAGGNPVSDNTPEQRVAKRYSIVRALSMKAEGRSLDGLEKEMHDEAVKEARESSLNITGIGVPSFIAEKRALSVGTDANGGYTVQTDVEEMVPNLEPELMVERLGARVLSGLRGNLSIPRNTGRGTANWEGEVTQATETTPTLDAIAMSPKRLAAWTKYSKQLLAQSSLSVENFVRYDLNRANRIAVDLAAINGSGIGNVPRGILNMAGVNTKALGTNGGTITFADLVELETLIASDDADSENMNYLMTAGMRGFLKTLKKDAGSGEFVWKDNEVNGYNAYKSSQVPSNLTKETGTNLHAAIFGDFSQLVVGNWGVMDLIVDPYTLADTGQVKVTTNSYWDIVARWEQAFAVIKDFDPTA